MKKTLKILISGGWGYANLGDDAILVSTIELVQAKYPDAEIVVMTFNPEETRKIISDQGIRLVTSINRLLSGVAFKRLQIAKNPQHFDGAVRPGSRVQRLYRKMLFKGLDRSAYYKYKVYDKKPLLCPAAKYFGWADIFIQAGGGYFIESWRDSFYARILELKIAAKFDLRTLVIGQSIGPFQVPELRALAVDALRHAAVLSVRDTDSMKELQSYGLDPVLVPDTVLARSDFDDQKKNILAIILGSKRLTSTEIDLFSKALLEMPDYQNIEVRIMVSRLWDPDLSNVHSLYERLKTNGKVSLHIPDSYIELQDLLGECRVLISQNLHGLILAWRAGCACISINNRRKFVSFMNQSGQSQRLSALKDLTTERLLEFIADAFDEDVLEMAERRHALSATVRADFNACLENVEAANVNGYA